MPDKGDTFQELLAEVIRFVEREVLTGRKKLTEHTDLYNDLRMDPYDAEDLMLKFFKIFDVLDADFEWNRYFPPEDTILMAFFRFLFFRPRRKPVKLVRLTIGMLAGAARDGVWRTEALEREFP
jgi:hypothetical protein